MCMSVSPEASAIDEVSNNERDHDGSVQSSETGASPEVGASSKSDALEKEEKFNDGETFRKIFDLDRETYLLQVRILQLIVL